MTSSFYTLYEHAPKGFIEKKGVHSKGFYLKLNNQNLIILLSTRQTISKSYQRSSQTVDIKGKCASK